MRVEIRSRIKRRVRFSSRCLASKTITGAIAGKEFGIDVAKATNMFTLSYPLYLPAVLLYFALVHLLLR
jgi:hypothetical protein